MLQLLSHLHFVTKKRKLDPNVDVPTCKSDIDKYYVVAYTKAHGTPEQRAAVKAAIKKNTVEKISNFTKKLLGSGEMSQCKAERKRQK